MRVRNSKAKSVETTGPDRTQSDSHKKSLSEAFVNSFGGYPIGYGLGVVILPVSTGWIQEDPYMANMAITFVYASVSFARSYFLRRVFDKMGIDDNFIRLGGRLYHRMRRSIQARKRANNGGKSR